MGLARNMPQAERRAAPETILQALSSDPAPGLCRRCPIGENAAFPFPPTGQTMKIAKDTAAGALLLVACGSVVVAAIIFIPYMIQ